jgi:hypothetical protein
MKFGHGLHPFSALTACCARNSAVRSAPLRLLSALAVLFAITNISEIASAGAPPAGSPINIEITPSVGTFGNVTVGAIRSQTIKITNNGASRVQFSRFTVNGPGFRLANVPSSLALGARASITFNVVFSPRSASKYSASVALISPPNEIVASILLVGTGVPDKPPARPLASGGSADLTITPSGASFGNVTLGTSNSQMIRITNNGGVPIQFNRLTSSGPGFALADVPPNLTLSPHTYITFNAVFSPRSASKYSASVALITPQNLLVASIPLSGTGVSPTLLLSANASSLSFGSVGVGTKNSSPVTLTNKGNLDVTVYRLMVTGLGFEATGVVNDAVLKPGQSVTLEASFHPTKAGATTGQISVVSTAVVSPTISLSGTGVESKASSVSLHWQAVSNILGYFVYRATTAGGPYTRLSSTVVPSSQYVDSVIPGHTYYYVVTAVDRANVESSYSNQAAASVPLVP